MGVLSRDEILAAVERGDIQVTPYDPKSIGPASMDLTLSNEFRFYKPGLAIVPVNESTDYKTITEKITLNESLNEFYLLLPGQSCLGKSREVEIGSEGGIEKEREKALPSPSFMECFILFSRS